MVQMAQQDLPAVKEIQVIQVELVTVVQKAIKVLLVTQDQKAIQDIQDQKAIQVSVVQKVIKVLLVTQDRKEIQTYQFRQLHQVQQDLAMFGLMTQQVFNIST